jgi:hypothetical protein
VVARELRLEPGNVLVHYREDVAGGLYWGGSVVGPAG